MSTLSGEIEDVPLGDAPLGLADLRAKVWNVDNFYLVPQPEGYCAYPLKPVGPPIFSLDDFFPREARDLPPLFGKPTTLPVPPGLDRNAAIYEAWRDQAYLPDIRGLRWYLVGSGERYEQMLDAISQYALQLLAEWRENPRAMAERTWPIPEGPEPSTEKPPSFLEAEPEIAKLGAWLQKVDPQLWADVQPLGYALQMPSHGCSSKLTEDSYAYYAPGENRIYLLPRSIRLLKEGKYSAVAQTLSHELSHRQNLQNGLALPSEEMMLRSLELFHGLVAEKSPLWGMVLSMLGEIFVEGMTCQRLPMNPEEEMDAFRSDLAYGKSQPPAKQSQETQEESKEGIDWLIQQVRREFPVPWQTLIGDYLELAGANHAQALPSSLRR